MTDVNEALAVDTPPPFSLWSVTLRWSTTEFNEILLCFSSSSFCNYAKTCLQSPGEALMVRGNVTCIVIVPAWKTQKKHGPFIF